MAKRVEQVSRAFEQAVRYAECVVAADAFLTGRTLSVLAEVRTADGRKLVDNLWRPEPTKCEETNFDGWKDRLMTELSRGKNC